MGSCLLPPMCLCLACIAHPCAHPCAHAPLRPPTRPCTHAPTHAPTHVPVSCMYRPPFWVHTSQISAGQGAALALTSGCAYGQLREVLGFAQITVACARSMCAAHHGIIAHVRTVSLCELVSRALMHGAADVGVCDVYMRVHDCTRACLYMCLYTCVCVRVCACCSRLCGPSCLQWQGDMGKG